MSWTQILLKPEKPNYWYQYIAVPNKRMNDDAGKHYAHSHSVYGVNNLSRTEQVQQLRERAFLEVPL